MESKEKINAITLRKLREIRGLSRKEAAILLNFSHKTIEKVENGRGGLKWPRVEQIIEAYQFTKEDFLLCREGKSEQVKEKFCQKNKNALGKKEKALTFQRERRFDKRVITKKIQVLKALRKLRNISQDMGSLMCGYHRAAIGHIENGRIELQESRIAHIVKSYGFTMEDFERHMKSENIITDVQDECISVIKSLSEEKLKVVYPIITYI